MLLLFPCFACFANSKVHTPPEDDASKTRYDNNAHVIQLAFCLEHNDEIFLFVFELTCYGHCQRASLVQGHLSVLQGWSVPLCEAGQLEGHTWALSRSLPVLADLQEASSLQQVTCTCAVSNQLLAYMGCKSLASCSCRPEAIPLSLQQNHVM